MVSSENENHHYLMEAPGESLFYLLDSKCFQMLLGIFMGKLFQD